MQVFKDHDERLIHALTQQNPFDRIERPLLADIAIHPRQRVVTLDDVQQRV